MEVRVAAALRRRLERVGGFPRAASPVRTVVATRHLRPPFVLTTSLSRNRVWMIAYVAPGIVATAEQESSRGLTSRVGDHERPAFCETTNNPASWQIAPKPLAAKSAATT